MMDNQAEVKASFKLLVFASMLTVALWFIPFADVVTHPVRLFATFIHETGHALAALVSFGSVERVDLHWSGSGETYTIQGMRWFVSSAGYLSTMLYGTGLLLLLRRARNARTAAFWTAGLLLVITICFAGNPLAWMTGLVIGGGCLLLGWKGKPRLTHFLMSFLAIQCVLNAIYDLVTLVLLASPGGGGQTDAANMEQATGGVVPAIVWALGWSLAAAGMLAGTLMLYYRSLKQRAVVADEQLPMLLPDHSTNSAQPQL